MKFLLVSSRFPWPAYSGDRMRTSVWAEALSACGSVALVAPRGEVPVTAGDVRFFEAKRSIARGVHGVMRMLAEGLPLQTLLAASHDWEEALARAAAECGPFDATIVILSRVDPWVRRLLGDGIRILDSVDSLRVNAAQRAGAALWLRRLLWRQEERRLERLESDVSRVYDHVVVVNEDETSQFGDVGTAIGNSVSIHDLDVRSPRRYDFAFWGRLAYFANADAADWLLEEIVPEVRRLHPAATFAMGGADAPRSLKAKAARAGVAFETPIASVPAFARDARVAILPVRFGSGQSSKLLEAGEAGCGVITTPQTLRGLRHLEPHVRVATDAGGIAAAAVDLLRDHAARMTLANGLRGAVELHYARAEVFEAMTALAGVPPARMRARAVTA
jgi:polysaccharide biosynthesis protein PslH